MSDTVRIEAIKLAKAAMSEMRGGSIVGVSPERSEQLLAIMFDELLEQRDRAQRVVVVLADIMNRAGYGVPASVFSEVCVCREHQKGTEEKEDG